MATITINTNQDTFIRKSDEYENYNGESYMPLGKTGSSSQVDRILLGFNLSALSGKIIESALLKIYQDYSAYATSDKLDFTAHRVVESWSASSVTWDTRPSYVTTAAVSLSLTGNSDGLRTFNITDLIKDTVENDRPYYGIILKQTDEDDNDLRKQFFSEEYGGASRQAYLYVTYYDMPLIGAVSQGSINKQIISAKAAVTQGAINKSITGMKLAATQGAINKTIF